MCVYNAGNPVTVQSLMSSICGIALEGFVMFMLLGHKDGAVNSILYSTAVVQMVVFAGCMLFATMLLRTLRRVHAQLGERVGTLQAFLSHVRSLQEPAWERGVLAVVRLQALFRGHRAVRALKRRRAMDAYNAAAPMRRLFVRLVHAVVVCYVLLCIYVIVLFGTMAPHMCARGAPRRRTCLCGDGGIVSCVTGLKFPKDMERTWLIAASAGFFLDVMVYHTCGLMVRSVLIVLFRIRNGTDGTTLALGSSSTAAICGIGGM